MNKNNSISFILNKSFKNQWHNIAARENDESYTYKDLYQYAASITDQLSLKCKPGDSIILNLPNSFFLLCCYLACIMGGFKFVPLHPSVSKKYKAFIKEKVGAKLILNEKNSFEGYTIKSFDKPDFKIIPNQILAIFFTSGTTGHPKGVTHTIESLINNAQAFNKKVKINNKYRLYHCLPMTYMAGFLNCIISPLVAGGMIIIGKEFNPSEGLLFWKKILNQNANALWITPTIASLLCRTNRDSLIKKTIKLKIRNIFCGTATLSNHTRLNFHKNFGIYLQESYGLSETLLVSVQSKSDANKESNAGDALENIFLTTKKIGCNKEIFIKTPFQHITYITNEGEITATLTKKGFASGDLGFIKNHKLNINGRIKDLIIKGGVNISSKEIENILFMEKAILDVCVMATPHDFWGEIVTAFLVCIENANKVRLEKKLSELCKKELGPKMIPDEYIWLDKLPKTISGKVIKSILLKAKNTK